MIAPFGITKSASKVVMPEPKTHSLTSNFAELIPCIAYNLQYVGHYHQ